MRPFLIVSCEHGGNAVPVAYAHLFERRAAASALRSHRGLDIGALELATAISEELDAPLYAADVTRLLVDLNRSLSHPQVFSEYSRGLDAQAKQGLIAAYYEPHRRRVTEAIRAGIARAACIWHVAVHSFVPRLGSSERKADIGLLYDPARAGERTLCIRWQQSIRRIDPDLRVRRNYPYRGKTDGFTTHLRRLFGPDEYVGIELEANQRLLRCAPARAAARLVDGLSAALDTA